MKKIFFIYIFLTAIALSATSQYSKHIIQFKDKKGTLSSLNNPSTYLSAKAITRRTKFNIIIDSTDLPLSSAYIDSVKAVSNVVILNKSKWLNQICIKTTDSVALAKINSFSFVRSIKPVAVKPYQTTTPISKKFETNNTSMVIAKPFTLNATADIIGLQDFYNYGNNLAQIRIHEGEYLHNLGFHGEGIIIAMLDAGFYNCNNNPAFDSIRLQNQIIGTWDYVNNEANVYEDHAHGTMCLSTIAANTPGKMVGTAPKSSFWLLRTEDAPTEYPVEEQNWVAAAEFADSAGVDIITSSLGYSDFSDTSFNHNYAQRDGKTAMISIGASLAVKKGILVTNSAGNSGRNATDAKYVVCPADAEDVLTIGATDVNGVIASFSSWGPNGAGKLKPDVVSVGAAVVVASATTGNPVTSNGTSFSNPNLCGLIACLWQAFPDFNNMEIADVVKKSSDKYTVSDFRYGYGLPNMKTAYKLLEVKREKKNYEKILGNNFIKAYPVPFNKNFSILLKSPTTGKATMRLTDMSGKTIAIKSIDIQQGFFYTVNFDTVNGISKGIYNMLYTDGSNKKTIRIVKL